VTLDETTAALEQLLESGDAVAIALVVAGPEGTLQPWWSVSRTLGAHAGSVLRGAVAYLGARMDAEALAAERAG
jgi:hypothetical protein